MTLTDFLLARIAEDDAEARHADEADGNWHYGSLRRVLADCKAKRRIVRRAAIDRGDWGDGYDSGIEDVLRDLALPYAEHPDYREEWKP